MLNDLHSVVATPSLNSVRCLQLNTKHQFHCVKQLHFVVDSVVIRCFILVYEDNMQLQIPSSFYYKEILVTFVFLGKAAHPRQMVSRRQIAEA